jgi:hypothetical protein
VPRFVPRCRQLDGSPPGGKAIDRARGSAYEVIKPAAGLTVFYLPNGYSQEKVKGVELYRFGDILFKPVFIQGILAYQVVEP